MLSAVDNRCDKRILYDVLDHAPTHDDIRVLLQRLHTALSARTLTLLGVTTDGASLYPTPLAEVCGDVPHQICPLHIVAEVSNAVLGAVASARQGLAAQRPPPCAEGARARQQPRRRPARKSDWKRHAPRCLPIDIWSCNGP
jgi:hypothetical protein